MNNFKETVLLYKNKMSKDSVLSNNLIIILIYLWYRDFKKYCRKYLNRL